MNQRESETVCGRCGCIIFYCGDNCIFCKPAEALLHEVRKNLGVPEDILCKVDIDCTEGKVFEAPVAAIPMMRVCDRTITGLPDESSIRDAILRIMVQSCYYESWED